MTNAQKAFNAFRSSFNSFRADREHHIECDRCFNDAEYVVVYSRNQEVMYLSCPGCLDKDAALRYAPAERFLGFDTIIIPPEYPNAE